MASRNALQGCTQWRSCRIGEGETQRVAGRGNDGRISPRLANDGEPVCRYGRPLDTGVSSNVSSPRL